MAPVFIRGSLLGKAIYHISRRKLLRYPEEEPDYVIPEKYLAGATSSVELSSEKLAEYKDDDNQLDAAITTTEGGHSNNNYIFVTWDGEDDPENPYNWPMAVRVTFIIMVGFLTTSIYMGASIYTTGIEQIMETYNVGRVVATLPMSLYVLAYGIGPMVWSPLTEHPPIGKLYIYLITLFVFVILQIPTALSKDMSIGALIVLRTLGGFFASPALATGGASVGDVMPLSRMPIGLATWGVLAVCAPIIAPLFGAIFTHFKDVFWTFWFLLILSGFTFVVLVLFMPESSQPTLLYRKAQRLRKLTGNENIVSEGELVARSKTTKQIAVETLVRPLQVALIEPMVLSVNLHVALMYATFYMFFEAFPLIFGPKVYNFTLIEQGLSYLAVVIGIAIGTVIYMIVVWKTYTKPAERGATITPEVFIPAAIFGSVALPVGLIIFGWSATSGTNWVGPLVGAGIFGGGAFIVFQTEFNYLGFSFPRFMASVFASNGLFRAVFACAFPLFTNIMYERLGPQDYPIGWGCTILVIATTLMIGIPVAFWKFGVQLRGRSKFAN